MDLTTFVLPGAQSLVTAILTDSWTHVSSGLSRLWARRRPDAHGAEPDAAALEQAATELDLAKEQALALAGDGPEPERKARMELFWAGYLAGQLAGRAELAEAIRAIPALSAEQPGTTIIHAKTSITFTGTGHNVIQTGDVSGGLNFRG